MQINRRRFAGLKMASLAMSWPRRAHARDMPPTPPEESGPVYPRIGPDEDVADLTRVAGQQQRALGQKIELNGRVVTPQGEPGSYPDGMGAGGWRTPRIHIEVTGEESRLLTQMYFEGEPRNDADMLFNAMRRDGRDAQALIAGKAGSSREPDSESYSWTVVMASR